MHHTTSKIAVLLLLVAALLGSQPMPGSFAFAHVPPGTLAPVPEQPRYLPGQVIAALHEGVSAEAVQALLNTNAAVPAANQPPAWSGLTLLNVPIRQEEQIAHALAKSPLVRLAEPNYLYQLHQLAAPSDPAFDVQWALNNIGQNGGTMDADVDWLEGYDATASSNFAPTLVAIIDTGVDPTHPDLVNKIAYQFDFIGGDGADTYGHGTHVSGITAASTNNAQGMAGVGFSNAVQLMSVRAGDEQGLSALAIVLGIQYATLYGARVINMSFGGPTPSSLIQDAVDDAWNSGVLLIASAGNEGSATPQYPAAYANVMAICATDNQDQLSTYSSWGNWLSVAAPGGAMTTYHDPGGIYSTMPTYDVYLTTQYSYAKMYDYLQGTSMAAPHVTGLAGLLFAQNSARTNVQVRSLIESTADDLGEPGFDSVYGYGRINVQTALSQITPEPPPPTPEPSGPVVQVASITPSIVSAKKGRDQQPKLRLTVAVVDQDSAAVKSAQLEMVLVAPDGIFTGAGRTDRKGTITFEKPGAVLDGSYIAQVTNISKSGYTFDPDDPNNLTTFEVLGGQLQLIVTAAPSALERELGMDAVMMRRKPTFPAQSEAKRTVLHQNYPNPFNPETWIPYELATDGVVRIRIYNAQGQEIRQLNLGYQPAGIYTTSSEAAYWDGRNATGQSVSSGVYYYTLRVGDFVASRKMLIVK